MFLHFLPCDPGTRPQQQGTSGGVVTVSVQLHSEAAYHESEPTANILSGNQSVTFDVTRELHLHWEISPKLSWNFKCKRFQWQPTPPPHPIWKIVQSSLLTSTAAVPKQHSRSNWEAPWGVWSCDIIIVARWRLSRERKENKWIFVFFLTSSLVPFCKGKTGKHFFGANIWFVLQLYLPLICKEYAKLKLNAQWHNSPLVFLFCPY